MDAVCRQMQSHSQFLLFIFLLYTSQTIWPPVVARIWPKGWTLCTTDVVPYCNPIYLSMQPWEQPAYPGSPVRWLLKRCMCVCMCMCEGVRMCVWINVCHSFDVLGLILLILKFDVLFSIHSNSTLNLVWGALFYLNVTLTPLLLTSV